MTAGNSQLPSIQSLFDLTGKRALVTGSSRGIGAALAAALAGAGAHVVLNGRDDKTLQNTCQQLASKGARVSAKAFDVTDFERVANWVEELEAEGPIDILVNNVGIQRRIPFLEFPRETWREVLDTNLTACFEVSQAVAKHMASRRRGKIINIASIQSELARATISAYATSKGAMQMLTRSMCAELAVHNIQVNALAPGYFDTELTASLVEDEAFSAWLRTRTPAGRWGDVAELGGTAVFLSSPSSDFVNGQTLFVDGGLLATV